MQFTFEEIDQLKRQYTDKLVAVDTQRPELQRFSGITGTVKTVNMSGRALVEFDAYNNIAWYDIDLDFLRVIDQPLPKIEAKEAAPAKPAPAAKGQAEPTEKPAAAKKPAAAGKPSTADILAAARANKAASLAGQAAPAAAKPAAPKPAAEKPAAAKGGKMSTADILAAARAKAQPAEEQPSPVAEGSTAESEVETIEAASKPQVPAAAKAAKPPASGSLPTTTAEIIAWCRQADAK